MALVFLISCAHSSPSTVDTAGSDPQKSQVKKSRTARTAKENSTAQKPLPPSPEGNAPLSAPADKDCPPEINAQFSAGQPQRPQGAPPAASDASREVRKDAAEAPTEELEDEMEEALLLLKQSESYRQKGDLEKALKSLDSAYALLLDVNGESGLARQKDDLRLMISMRIVQIYTSKSGLTNGRRSEIPMLMNPDVEKEIRSFQTVERNFFTRSYQRSGLYLPIIKRYLKDAGLPQELAWLPLVESGFQVNALSRARALGLWQFIPSTGYKYGLNRDLWVDERMDVDKSTKGAIAYLKELHGIFGDWLTVLAAYNCGEGRVLKVISQQHINYLDRFWDLYNQLPYETARYVPRFLATLHIIKDPKKYGMELGSDVACPIDFETVRSRKSMRLQDIALTMNVSKETLSLLNPELRHQQTPDQPYDLKVPAGTGGQFALVEDRIEEAKPPVSERVKGKKYVKHRVRQGESIQTLSKQYGVSTKTLLAYNGMKSETPLKAGRIIKVPVAGGSPKKAKVAKKDPGKKTTAKSDTALISYKVKQGDTLYGVAQKYKTSAADIRKLNNLKSDQLKTGQVIKIRNAKLEAGT